MITLLKTNRETGRKVLKNVSTEEFMELLKGENPYIPELRVFVANALLNGEVVAGEYCKIDKIPKVHPSVAFRRKGDDVLPIGEYSGIVMLEVGNLNGKRETDYIKQQASLLPSTYMAFVGSSGRSVKIWVKCARPDGSLPDNRQDVEGFHKLACEAAVRCYGNILSQPVAVRDESPLAACRMSQDESPVYFPESLPLRISPYPGQFEQWKRGEAEPLARLESDPDNERRVFLHFTNALKRAQKHLASWKRGDNPEPLLPYLIEECFREGVPEAEVCHRICLHFPYQYKDNGGERIAMEALVRSIYEQCKGLKLREAATSGQETMLEIDRFMKKKLDLRYNEFTDCVEVRRKVSTDYTFRPMTKRLQNTLAIEAMNESINSWDRDIERYLNSEYVPIYNPVEDYFFNLEKWDGKDRIAELAARIPCTNPDFPRLFRRWLLNMVAHWLNPNLKHANSTILVLVGAQGIGKSTFCRHLLPPELSFAYTDRLDLQSKRDAEMYLSHFLLVNIDEYDQLSDRQQAFMKYLLSVPATHRRKLYGTAIEKHARYASFIATSNIRELLNDPTGNRRYLCVEVDGDIRMDRPVNYGQLYAQLLKAIYSRERTWFDREEEKLIEKGNRGFETFSPVLDRFWRCFRAPSEGEAYEELSASAIYEELTSRSERTRLGMNYPILLGRLLHKANVPCHRTGRGTVYRCVRLKGTGR